MGLVTGKELRSYCLPINDIGLLTPRVILLVLDSSKASFIKKDFWFWVK